MDATRGARQEANLRTSGLREQKTLQFSSSGVSFYNHLSKPNIAKRQAESQCSFMTFVAFPDIKFAKFNKPKQEGFIFYILYYYIFYISHLPATLPFEKVQLKSELTF